MPAITLTRTQRAELDKLLRCGKTEVRLHRRSRMVLLAADKVSIAAIARELATSRSRVRLWLQRFLDCGVKGLADRPRSGRPKKITALERHEVIAAACRKPEVLGLEQTVWSHRTLSTALVGADLVHEISASTVGRILRAGDLKPHRVKMWCHSKDPLFRERMHDIVRLYLDPPPGEPVICVDEKTGMQALSRPGGLRVATPGRPGRLDSHYCRHGTLCLFGCFNIRTGKVRAACTESRTRQDFFGFMDSIAASHTQRRVHVILDNLNTHRDTSRGDFVSQWNRRHGNRFVFHYTPTHGSWLNQIELWFGILARRVLRYGSFESKAELRDAVIRFVDQWNQLEAHPFRWTYEGVPLAA